MERKREFDDGKAELVLISADPPEASRKWRTEWAIPFVMLSDPDHAIADRYAIAISRRHPTARKYRDGFIQPAILAYRGEEEIYRFIAVPGLMNLYGATGRPSPGEILAAIPPP